MATRLDRRRRPGACLAANGRVRLQHRTCEPVLDADRWQRLIEFWAMRHVFTHNDGLVDARFLTKVPTSTARIGQRLTLTEQQCRQAITASEVLCHALVGLTC
jgi:hypothetical protein